MMTFKEYLQESSIMSTDALRSAMSDYDKRRMGKTDGSKPKAKRLDQMDKRKARKAGYSEEEEPIAPARRERVDRLMKTPHESPTQKPSLKRQVQRGARTLRSSRGIGSNRKNALQLDEL